MPPGLAGALGSGRGPARDPGGRSGAVGRPHSMLRRRLGRASAVWGEHGPSLPDQDVLWSVPSEGIAWRRFAAFPPAARPAVVVGDPAKPGRPCVPVGTSGEESLALSPMLSMAAISSMKRIGPRSRTAIRPTRRINPKTRRSPPRVSVPHERLNRRPNPRLRPCTCTATGVVTESAPTPAPVPHSCPQPRVTGDQRPRRFSIRRPTALEMRRAQPTRPRTTPKAVRPAESRAMSTITICSTSKAPAKRPHTAAHRLLGTNRHRDSARPPRSSPSFMPTSWLTV